jgi:ribonuclease BN (tRNA processing enzyme)
MSAREAAVRARDAGVKRLVLTHLVPGSDPEAHRAEAEVAYGGPVEVALPGCTFTI